MNESGYLIGKKLTCARARVDNMRNSVIIIYYRKKVFVVAGLISSSARLNYRSSNDREGVLAECEAERAQNYRREVSADSSFANATRMQPGCSWPNATTRASDVQFTPRPITLPETVTRATVSGSLQIEIATRESGDARIKVVAGTNRAKKEQTTITRNSPTINKSFIRRGHLVPRDYTR